MDPKANYRLVGAFVILSSMVFMLCLLWMANLEESRNQNFYSIFFRQHSLSGLQKDSYVTMKGITVGSVVDYVISPRSVEEVKVTIRLEPGTPVTTGTEAIITRNLLTGLAAVELRGTTDGEQLLAADASTNNYPVIPEGISTFSKIADSIPGVLENISSLSARASAVLSDKNIKHIETTLEEVEAFSKAANKSMSTVEGLIDKLQSLSATLNSASSTVSELANDSTQSVKETLQELAETLKQAKKTFSQFEIQTEAISTSFVNTSQVISQQVTTLGQSVGEAADSVSHTAESFENPRALITGPSERALGPGESIGK